jgi:dynein heavy chain, axonemal
MYYKQWIKSQNFKNKELNDQLHSLFEKYIPETFDYLRKFMKFIVPVVEITLVVNICKFIQSILSKQEVKGLEFLFVFACVWAIGAGFSEKDGKDFRKDFSNWWKDKFKTIKFPTKDTVFDYYVDLDASKLEEWAVQVKDQKIPDIDTSKAISNYTIPTSDTVSIQYFMQQYISVDHPPLLVGNAGCGKTQIAKGLLKTLSLNTEAY